jgi:Domain of unknown function (DUF4926)
MPIAEHDVLVLMRDLPELGLRKGDVGTAVQIYGDGKAYEVEFVTGSGRTLALETLEAKDLRPLGDAEILHSRSVAAA